MLAQHSARILIQRFHIVCHVGARQDAHRLDHAEAEAPREPGQRLVARKGQKRLEERGHLAVDEVLQAPLHLLGHIGTGLVIDESLAACGGIDIAMVEAGADRFLELGVAPDRVHVTGTMKFDTIKTEGVEEVRRAVREELGIAGHLENAVGGHFHEEPVGVTVVATLEEVEAADAAEQRRGDGLHLVVDSGEQIVGLLDVTPLAWNYTAWVWNIMLDESIRGYGIGRNLFQRAATWARSSSGSISTPGGSSVVYQAVRICRGRGS